MSIVTVRLQILLSLLLIGCGSGKPPGSDGEEMTPPDLPASGECGDGTPEPGELCFEQVTTAIPDRGLHPGDFDGDGLVDFVQFDSQPGGRDATLWKGYGAGGFELQAVVSLDDPAGAYLGGHVANVDGDSWTDVLAVEGTLEAGAEAQIRSFINDGPWSFGAVVDSQVTGAGEPWNRVFVFDVDSDGRDDLIAEPYYTSGPLHVVLNGDAGFEASGLQIEGSEECWSSAWAPIPSFSTFAGGIVIVLGECEEVPTGTLVVVLSLTGGDVVSDAIPTAGILPGEAAAGDFDGDENPELIVWDRGLRSFELFRADVAGSFSKVSMLEVTDLCPSCGWPMEVPGPVKIDSGNFDGDPTSDIMLSLSSALGSELHFGLNPLKAAAQWHKWEDFEGPAVAQLVVDLDADGIDEVMFAATETVYALVNNY